MLIEWRLLRPNSQSTENQIATQLTSIKRNNLIPAPLIEIIKNEVANDIHLSNTEITIQPNPETENVEEIHLENILDQDEHLSDERPEHVNETNNHRDQRTRNEDELYISEIETKLIEKFNTTRMMYEMTEPNNRPLIKKLKPNKKVYQLTEILNKYIESNIKEVTDLEDLQTIIYCTAKTVTEEILPATEPTRIKEETRKNNTPKWKIRLEMKINTIRSRLNKINDWQRNKGGRKLEKEVMVILKRLDLDPNAENFNNKLMINKDEMKQRIAVYGKRIRRYNTSYNRKNQNYQFRNNEKAFYNQLNTNTVNSEPHQEMVKSTTKDELEKFWKDIWKNKGDHKKEASWIINEKNKMEGAPPMEESNFTLGDIKEVMSKLHNWKAPGPDSIQNFWWKNIDSLHHLLATQINHILSDPADTPMFMTEGITYMKAKTPDISKPQNFRPITCLTTIYKIITSLISNKINRHIEDNNLLTEEQKGCRRRTQGCKEQLIIDGIVTKESKDKQRNVAIAWLDYQKAFDSVPHSYLLEVLEIYKVDRKIISFLQLCMKSWRTKLIANLGQSQIQTDPIRIESGIFQGDSLSPTWFIMCLNPLSKLLASSNLGYKLKTQSNFQKLSHLLYVDDAKLYAENEQDLSKLLNIAKTFSDDIKMNFGYDKCAKVIYKKGKTVSSENIDHMNIKQLSDTEKYKYLGLDQHLIRNTSELKKQTEEKLNKRVVKILKSHLTGKNKIKAINTWAIPVISYTFGILEWTQTDMNRLDRKIRTNMTRNRIHHTNASVIRLYIPRKAGGRGLLNLENLRKKQIINLRKYFREKDSVLLKTISEIDKYSPLKMTNNEHTELIATFKDRKEEWLSKALHGRYPKSLSSGHPTESTSWLTTGELYGETEGFMCAIQDGVINTKNYRKFILKEHLPDDLCRMCKKTPETIQHIISGCTLIAHTEYLKRHNLTAGILHQKITLKHKLSVETEVPYYQYTPHPVLENDSYKLYWDLPIRTDKTVASNRPDIVLHDKLRKEAYFIDIAHPNDNNLEKTEREKITKYFELCQEYKTIYKLNKVIVIPVIISSTGIVSKNIFKYLSNIHLDDKYIVRQMQKSLTLETCRIVRKCLNIQE